MAPRFAPVSATAGRGTPRVRCAPGLDASPAVLGASERGLIKRHDHPAGRADPIDVRQLFLRKLHVQRLQVFNIPDLAVTSEERLVN